MRKSILSMGITFFDLFFALLTYVEQHKSESKSTFNNQETEQYPLVPLKKDLLPSLNKY